MYSFISSICCCCPRASEVQDVALNPINAGTPQNPEPPQEQVTVRQSRRSCTHIIYNVLRAIPGVSFLVRQIVKIYHICNNLFFKHIVRSKTVEQLELIAQRHLSAQTYEMLQASRGQVNYYKALKGLTSSLNIGERAVLETIERFTQEQFVEFLKGANIRLNDNGELYDKWMELPHRKNRVSSHPSNGSQYAIRGNFLKENLFYIRVEDGRRYTRLQLEAEPVTLTKTAEHMCTYLRYRCSGLNQGPYGESEHNDRNPLIIDNPHIPQVPLSARNARNVNDWRHFGFSSPMGGILCNPLPTSRRQQKRAQWHQANDARNIPRPGPNASVMHDERDLFSQPSSSESHMRFSSEVEKEHNSRREESRERNHDEEPLQSGIQIVVTDVANRTSHVGGQSQ